MQKIFISELFSLSSKGLKQGFKKMALKNDIGELGDFLDEAIIEVSGEHRISIVVYKFRKDKYGTVILPFMTYIEANGNCYIEHLVSDSVRCINGGRICTDIFETSSSNNTGVYHDVIKYISTTRIRKMFKISINGVA